MENMKEQEEYIASVIIIIIYITIGNNIADEILWRNITNVICYVEHFGQIFSINFYVRAKMYMYTEGGH